MFSGVSTEGPDLAVPLLPMPSPELPESALNHPFTRFPYSARHFLFNGIFWPSNDLPLTPPAGLFSGRRFQSRPHPTSWRTVSPAFSSSPRRLPCNALPLVSPPLHLPPGGVPLPSKTGPFSSGLFYFSHDARTAPPTAFRLPFP